MTDRSSNSVEVIDSPIQISSILAPQTVKEFPTIEKTKRMVKILVHQKPFFFHENFLFYYSPYFESAFQRTLSTIEVESLEYNETTIEVFSIFAGWVYAPDTVSKDKDVVLSYETIIGLWLLGDQLQCPKLQNQAMKALASAAKLRNDDIPSKLLKGVYEKTTKHSPLRAYIVDYFANRTKGVFSSKNYPHQFLFDVVNKMKSLRWKHAEIPNDYIAGRGINKFFVPEGDEEEEEGKDLEVEDEGEEEEPKEEPLVIKQKSKKKSSKRQAEQPVEEEDSRPAKKTKKSKGSRSNDKPANSSQEQNHGGVQNENLQSQQKPRNNHSQARNPQHDRLQGSNSRYPGSEQRTRHYEYSNTNPPKNKQDSQPRKPFKQTYGNRRHSG